jgi:hypothetical protein
MKENQEGFIRDINAKTGIGTGLRFNKGKLRYSLVNAQAHRDMVEILTYGAEKYTIRDDNGNIINDGSHNWENGLSWTSVYDSLKRHMAAIEAGEDYDKDTKKLHIAHAACNVHFLNAYYYIFPQGDDRIKYINKIPKIGFDIDELLADFVGAWADKYGTSREPKSWFYDRKMGQRFADMRKSGELDEFYMNIKPLILPNDLPIEPHCYITSRPVSTEITEAWLDLYEFPAKPVYTVGIGENKSDIAKKAGVEMFIDDSYNNFVELNNNGITTYLYTRSHNIKFDVGHLRLNSLNDLPFLQQ